MNAKPKVAQNGTTKKGELSTEIIQIVKLNGTNSLTLDTHTE